MFAILKTGGKQYKVAKEEKLLIEKIDGNIGDEVVFNDIILINDNGKTEIGSPLVKDAAVVAEVVKQTRGPKITIIYKRRRKNSRRKQGHKQDLTLLKVKSIASTGASKIQPKKAVLKKNPSNENKKLESNDQKKPQSQKLESNIKNPKVVVKTKEKSKSKDKKLTSKTKSKKSEG